VKSLFNLSGKESHIPLSSKIAQAIASFSLTEKILFGLFGIIFIISSLVLLYNLNNRLMIHVPRFGGTHQEGVIGTPRSINPLLAVSETDRDLSTLIYSGLMRITPEGTLIPDLALEYNLNEDGTEYTFIIRGDAVFHDGEKVTADDVVFTIKKAQDPAIKSPKRADWEGVLVEKVSDQEVRFILPQAYSPFLFNTTLGILPEHIWKDVSSEEFPFTQRNIEPIGSGPYSVGQVKRNASGVTERFALDAFSKFTLGRPYIKHIVFTFYKNEDELITALREKSVQAINSISPDKAIVLEHEGFRTLHFPLPRIFGVFFNQSQAPILASQTVRSALNTAVDRKHIIDTVLSGYATEITGPAPAHLVSLTNFTSTKAAETDITLTPTEQAVAILDRGGFAPNESGVMERKTKDAVDTVKLNLATADVPELVAVAEQVVVQWRAAGIDANLKVFDRTDFTQNVIRPRKYDAILFGEVIGRDLDFYPFWHSSQRTDPGLNIADYANITVDTALEKSRTLTDGPDRTEKIRTFMHEVEEDTPAVFLYSPDFIYIVPQTLEGIIPKYIGTPSDRFLAVYNWYLETDTVWNWGFFR
jgi:peptide/nickel transport system substrate-binding protein